MFMVFTQADLPPAATIALETVANFSSGVRLPELITTLSQKLSSAFATGSREAPYSIDDDSDVPMGGVNENESSNEEADSEDYAGYDSGADDFGTGAPGVSSSATYRLSEEAAKKLNRRIRHDLRAAKMAGFTIGVINGMKAESVNSLLSISIRVAKLGLSDEAIQAWDLEPQQYIVLLIRFSSGYKTFEAVISEPAKSHDIAFRIGVSNRYKPTVTEALAAFTDATKNMDKDDEKDKPSDNDEAGFANLFISSSLNDFITQQFISLLKIRYSVGVSWDGAKQYFNDKQGKFDKGAADLPSTYYEEPSEKDTTLPTAIANDHLTDHQVRQISFPLIAAQFAMRYLVRCTDFCLVCHDKIEEDFEALKPYVCSKPLCLYQYMSLGFGPSVEHEILTQPYVVDLLISFCYASAFVSLPIVSSPTRANKLQNRRLREYPTGMSLSVPPVYTSVTRSFLPPTNFYHQQPVVATDPNDAQVGVDVKLDLNRQELIFEDNETCPVQVGNWVVVSVPGTFIICRNKLCARLELTENRPSVRSLPC
jgi:ubiquitin-conjugating enzyme E2 Q